MKHDVIVLGSGLAGSTMAAILARHGHSVLMLEKGRHPRFALGEATLPQTSYWMWLIGERFDVRELKLLADARTVSSQIAPTSGVKRSIGFAYHRAGVAHDMVNNSHQVLAPELPFQSESHFYREDIDQYMAGVATGYGASLLEDTEVVAVAVNEGGVSVTDRGGTEHRARFLVDASSFSSIVTSTFELREQPTRLRTRSRSIFTHVEGLGPFDDLFPPEQRPGLKYRWHEGTLHHVFDGGWLWVIPFGNHADSRNSLASIGLTLDMDKFPPREDLTAEEEFWEVVGQFPSVAAAFQAATPTRPYIRTGRLQYSCAKAVGDRVFVTPQAYGAVDALYSRGLINTFEMTYCFAGRLLEALDADDFTEERFAGLDELARSQLDLHDQMVQNAYRSFADFDAWNAWLKVWLASKLFGDIWLLRTTLRYRASHDRAELDRLALATPPFTDPLRHLIDISTTALAEADGGQTTWATAAERINAALQSADWLPNRAYAWNDPTVHHGDFTPPHVMPLVILWGKLKGPRWLRQHLFDFPVRPLVAATVADKVSTSRPARHKDGRTAAHEQKNRAASAGGGEARHVRAP